MSKTGIIYGINGPVIYLKYPRWYTLVRKNW